MDELKAEFLDFAYKYYEQYVSKYHNTMNISPYLILPLSYIEFAQEETHMFKLLFINDMNLDMTESKDFYKEIGKIILCGFAMFDFWTFSGFILMFLYCPNPS